MPLSHVAILATGAICALSGCTPGGGVVSVGAPAQQATATGAAVRGPAPQLHVSGRFLVTQDDRPIQLRGVNRAMWGVACLNGHVTQGPVSLEGTNAIAAWGANAIRIQLNEDCYLGINGVPAASSGAVYRDALGEYVKDANESGLDVILTLGFNAPGSELSTQEETMADESHAPTFWADVTHQFGNNRAVIFDLYNEPRPFDGATTPAAWSCILNGGNCGDSAFTIGDYTFTVFPVAGMQQLVDLVRQDGSKNVLMIGGAHAANSLNDWLKYEPKDPMHDLAASIHVYNNSGTLTSEEHDIAPVAAKVPVITGEMGEDGQQFTGCSYSYDSQYTAWADSEYVSYLAFDWDDWKACDGLITNYNGTPRAPYGTGWREHLLKDAAAPPRPDWLWR